MRDYLEDVKWLEDASDGAVSTSDHQPESDPIELINEAMSDLPWLPEDKQFLRSRLAQLGIYGQQRRRVLEQYKATWLKATENEPDPIKTENSGRRAANSWLRDL